MTRPFALVTGASSGIGAEFARQLAPDHDLVVVARDEERLRSAAATLRDRWGSSVEVLVADLSSGPGMASVEARVSSAERPIDLLINNAGIASYGRLDRLPVADEDRMVQLNVTAVLRLTRAALPGMVARRRGAVLNVASLGAFQPGPQCATYVATKAFVLSLTESIAAELRGTGVHAMVLCPGFTRTEFPQRSGMTATSLPDALWMTPEAVVGAALADLARKKVVCVPGAGNKVMASATRLLPRGAVRRLAGAVTDRL